MLGNNRRLQDQPFRPLRWPRGSMRGMRGMLQLAAPGPERSQALCDSAQKAMGLVGWFGISTERLLFPAEITNCLEIFIVYLG